MISKRKVTYFKILILLNSRRTRQTLWGGRTDANPKLSLNDT